MFVEVIVCYISVVFLRHSVHVAYVNCDRQKYQAGLAVAQF